MVGNVGCTILKENFYFLINVFIVPFAYRDSCHSGQPFTKNLSLFRLLLDLAQRFAEDGSIMEQFGLLKPQGVDTERGRSRAIGME